MIGLLICRLADWHEWYAHVLIAEIVLFSANLIAEWNFSSGLNVNAKKDRVKDKKMTNGDWLRAQDDDAMAVFIMVGEIFVRTSSASNDKAVTMKEILDWLKAEHKEG